MRTNNCSGTVQLTGLALAAGLTALLAAAAAHAAVAGRQALHRVLAWHLAKGLALEFSREEVGRGRLLDDRPLLEELEFASRTAQLRPETARFLRPFRITVDRDEEGTRVAVRWSEGGRERTELECVSEPGP